MVCFGAVCVACVVGYGVADIEAFYFYGHEVEYVSYDLFPVVAFGVIEVVVVWGQVGGDFAVYFIVRFSECLYFFGSVVGDE